MDGSLNCAVFSWNTSKTVDLSITPSFVHLYCKVKKVFLRERERERERDAYPATSPSIHWEYISSCSLSVSNTKSYVKALSFPNTI